MANDGSQTLLTAFALNEAGPPVQWPGTLGMFSVSGTFGGATVKLQFSPDNGTTWIDVDKSGDTDATFTSAGGCAFDLGPVPIRAIVSGGTAASLNAKVRRV